MLKENLLEKFYYSPKDSKTVLKIINYHQTDYWEGVFIGEPLDHQTGERIGKPRMIELKNYKKIEPEKLPFDPDTLQSIKSQQSQPTTLEQKSSVVVETSEDVAINNSNMR